jgi:hypothetical protein
MKRNCLASIKCWILSLFAITLIVSCRSNRTKLSTAETDLVRDSVTSLAANIARDISGKGPVAWLQYFENSPDFFMASDGQLALQGYESAKKFILKTLIKSIPAINLKWSHLRIDPLANDLASIGADFHEDLTDATGKTLSYDGYFTGLAHYDGRNWKLRNLHWSIKPPSVK